MKKLILLGLVILLCSPLAAYAASIFDAETQGQSKFSIGLDLEYMVERNMEYDSGVELDPGEEIENVKVEKLYRIMLKGSFGLLPWLDAYVRLGVADDKFEADDTSAGVTFLEIDSKSDLAFAYGGGLKAAFPIGNNFLIGADLQYLYHKNKIEGDLTDVLGLGIFGPGVTTMPFDGDATFQEWHFAPYAAYKIQSLTPYVGVRYSDLRLKTKLEDETGDTTTIKFEADNNFGLFGGFSYAFTPNLKLNLEGRFIDETALSLGLIYKF